jgi:hypothetical protein
LVAPTTASTSGSANNERLVSVLNAIPDKKKLREKTCVQVKITCVENPAKSALVVLSGATDMKKVNQLCAALNIGQGMERASRDLVSNSNWMMIASCGLLPSPCRNKRHLQMQLALKTRRSRLFKFSKI